MLVITVSWFALCVGVGRVEGVEIFAWIYSNSLYIDTIVFILQQ